MIPWTTFGLSGRALVEDPTHNKGTAFTFAERRALNLHGLVPAIVETIEQQAKRVMWNIERMEDSLEKYQFIMNLAEVNQRLFFHCLSEFVTTFMPIVYTPTVGLACQKFGYVFQSPRGMYITIKDVGRVHSMLRNWPNNDIKAICFTDGERILGLGDLGAFGMGIPIGKLALYTACAGIHPSHLLPVMIDSGTNNEELLKDPFYTGIKEKRTRGEQYDQLLDEFMRAVVARWGPSTLIQWEDFANQNAYRMLSKYQDKYNTFNDDIQGTASVALAGVYSACRITKTKISENVIVMFGAGSAGLGIANLIASAMVNDEGITVEEARKCIWLVDSRGLVVKNRSTGGVSPTKAPFAHEFDREVTDLAEIVAAVKATCIMGVSGQGQAFTEPVVRAMARNCERPIILPMSNPTHKAECSAANVFAWTDDKGIFASGSPFPTQMVNGKELTPSQGNNAYIFPGVALGVIATKALRCPECLFTLAAKTLAEMVTPEMLEIGMLYPSLTKIRSLSVEIAVKIGEECFKLGIASAIEPKNMRDLITSVMYDHTRYPKYNHTELRNVTKEFTGRASVIDPAQLSKALS